MGHGVTGIDAQVQQNLVQLRSVAQDRRELFVIVKLQPNVLGKGALHDTKHLLDQMDGLNGDALALRAFGEGQQLPYHVRAALGTGLNGAQDL